MGSTEINEGDRLKTGSTVKYPGFDGLRLLAATAVVFSHAFLLATGTENGEPLVWLLGPGNIIGLYAVFTFFIISGFLLSRSLQVRPNATTFVVNRALRIYPGLACCILVSAFVIGPLVTSLNLGQYFSSSEVPGFLRKGLSAVSNAELPGVFAYEGGGLQTVVNGSLWTLRYEILSYLFLLTMWLVVRSPGRLAAVMTASAVLIQIPVIKDTFSGIAYTLPYFSCGVLMQWVGTRHRTSLPFAALACALLFVASRFNVQLHAFAPLGAYLVVFIGERTNVISRMATRFGDCSYGVYLYGWPAEQLVKQATGTVSPMALFGMAMPLTLALAFASCHLVEIPAMRRRKRAADILKSFHGAILGFAEGELDVVRRVARVSFIIAAMTLLTILAWSDLIAYMGLGFILATLSLILFGILRRLLGLVS